MATTLSSPGELSRESDQSFVAQVPAPIGAAIIGPTVKGKVGIPKVVTTYSEYSTYFGTTFTSGSDQYTYLTSISAFNYFQNGGTSLLVTRVASGSFTSATSSFVSASGHATGTTTNVFDIEIMSDGALQNSTGPLNSNGTLDSGSVDNLRWEIASPNTSSGTFTLLVRRGDDSANIKTVVEQWNNLSLDPKATNYIARVIGDQIQAVATDGSSTYLQITGSYPNNSKYIRIKNVNIKTPDYFDNSGNAKLQYTSSIPLATSGTMGGASGVFAVGTANYYENISDTNIQGLLASNYATSIALLANQDDFQYNIITAPGLIDSNASHSVQLTTLINNTTNRGDAIVVMDTVNYGATVSSVVSKALTRDSSYTATYWPWLQTNDPNTGNTVWVPASTLIPGAYAANDIQGEPWFAPAGVNRGGLTGVVRAERKLTQGDRDTLYQGKINPIATFPGTGVTIFGQKTLQTKASALDRVNVRRLLITLKAFIGTVGKSLIFEQNTIATRNSFLAQVNPYLASVQQRSGLYAFKVIMDDSNNTPDTIDRNQLMGAIYLQPTKTSEFVYLDFNIMPSGISFS